MYWLFIDVIIISIILILFIKMPSVNVLILYGIFSSSTSSSESRDSLSIISTEQAVRPLNYLFSHTAACELPKYKSRGLISNLQLYLNLLLPS